jgi:adenine-specific DNA-methyltransferase
MVVVNPIQGQLDFSENSYEDPAYLTEQLITYIGNKRSLIQTIGQVVDRVRWELGGRQLRTLDAFSGSGVVTRLLKSRSSWVGANDIEDYATIISNCYLTNHSDVPWSELHQAVAFLQQIDESIDSSPEGFFERLYAPADEDSITIDDRVFYTKSNARRLDLYRTAIDAFRPELQTLLLGPLLSEASIHANTAGVFKGFYKDKVTGIGRFGGSGADALLRIKGPITPRVPVLSRFESQYEVYQGDANDLPGQVGDLDLVYLDPPYNQHPYGSNYFMLNLLVHNQEPIGISRVSGIPTNWNRSDYNVRSRSLSKFSRLIHELDTRYILISFNDEGFIAPDDMRDILNQEGEFTEQAIGYNTFRGSRNLAKRSIHVTEHLFLLKKG